MRNIYRLAWPVFLTQMAIILNGMIDTVMAGQLSALDLAAVGIGSAVFASIFITVSAVLLALTPTVSHLYGAGQHDAIGAEVRQAAWLGLALIILVETLLLYPDPLLAISQLDPLMDAKVRSYLAAMAWSAPASMAARVFTSFSAGIGRPRPVMALSLAGLLCKIPLNWVFMHGHLGMPALGATGCGVSTAVINWSMAVVAWTWCYRWDVYRPYALFTRWDTPQRAPLAALLKLGLPIGATFLVDVTAFTFMALFIARLGPVASGAHQIAGNLAVMCFMLPTAIGNAGGVLTGQALGAGKPDVARRIGLRAWRLGLACTLLLATVLALLRDTLAAFYSADPAVRSLAASLILLVAGYHLADGLQSLAVNLLRGYKKATVPMVVYAIAQWGLGLGGGVLLGLGFGDAGTRPALLPPPLGPAGFWIASALALLVAGGTIAMYWHHVSRAAARTHTATIAA